MKIADLMSDKELRKIGYGRCSECDEIFKVIRKRHYTHNQACRKRRWRRLRGV